MKQQYPGLVQLCKLMGCESDTEIDSMLSLMPGTFTTKTLAEANQAAIDYDLTFQRIGGIPFPGDDEIYDIMLRNDYRVQSLQKVVEYLDA